MACGGSETDRVGEGVGGCYGGGEDIAVAGEDFVAGSEGEREAAEGAEAEVGVSCALVAGVLAERVGVDGVAVGFEAVGEGDVGGEVVGAAEGGFVAGGDVVVFVDGGLVDKEDEEVGVAAVAEAGGGLRAELLLDAGEPAFGALP